MHSHNLESQSKRLKLTKDQWSDALEFLHSNIGMIRALMQSHMHPEMIMETVFRMLTVNDVF
jgi:hypothetical protein